MKIEELYNQVRDGKIISDIDLQREIIYKDDKQALVVDSIMNDIPLPAFYFWKNESGILEVLDGKQRIEAIKKFKENDLEYNGLIWKQENPDFQKKFNDTELTVIICNENGDKTEQLKREIFRRINMLGVPLSPFEILNGLFSGEYLRGLSTYVSNDKDCIRILGDASRGKRQMRILKYLCTYKGIKDMQEYVKMNQNNSFANDQREIDKFVDFVSSIFDEYGQLDIYMSLAFKYYKDSTIWKNNKKEINDRVKRYLKSEDSKLTDKKKEIEDIIQAIVKGISVDPKRLFTQDDKDKYLATKTPNSEGKYQCESPDGCGQWFYPEELQMDHKIPWSKGGRTELSNAQLLCRACNIKKSNN